MAVTSTAPFYGLKSETGKQWDQINYKVEFEKKKFLKFYSISTYSQQIGKIRFSRIWNNLKMASKCDLKNILVQL